MNNKIKNVCIFASSCDYIDKIYFEEAKKLGKEIAENGYNIVYGGSNLGLMGEVTSTAKKHGSKIVGVMPEKLYNFGINPGDCDEFIITKGMRERKEKMDKLSEALIAIAGGFGTLEELTEMIVQKQLGYNNKPIVILNTNGYYSDLIKFFNRIINEKFAPEITSTLYFIANSANDAVEYINSYKFQEVNYLDKKIIVKK